MIIRGPEVSADLLGGSLRYGEDFVVVAPELRRLYELWDGLRGARACPAWSEIGPVRLKPWLKRVYLAAYDAQAEDYYWRVVGSEIVQMRGNDPSRTFFRGPKHKPQDEVIRAIFDLTLREGVPLRGEGRSLTPERDFVMTESLMLPLLDGPADRRASLVMGAQVYTALGITARAGESVRLS